MKRISPKTANIFTTLLLAVALFICMWIVYERGVEKGQNTFNIERFKPDTTGVKIVTLTADPYDVDVVVLIGQDKGKVAQLLRWYLWDATITPDTLNARAITFWPDSTSPGVPCIWIPEIPKDADNMGLFSHEMTHMTHLIMDYAGIVYSDEAEEAFAYENGYLTRQFYDKCSKLK